jgi:formylglycine-generating enzyme required for sulfatase activity
MKKILVIAALALWGMAARPGHGQQGKLVVTPFENRESKLSATVLNNLQEYLINAFINTGHYQVPDRNALTLLAQEQKFQLSDWADDTKTAQMGKVLNADYIVRVIVMHDGEYNIMTARILEVNTANGLSAGEMEFKTQSEARSKMEDFARGILVRIGNGERPAASGVPEGFVLVEGGTFMMGSPSNEPGRDDDEGPQHQVTVKSFYMGKYEGTQREWQELMGNNPSKFRGDKLPVEQVSWYEAIEYCN